VKTAHKRRGPNPQNIPVARTPEGERFRRVVAKSAAARLHDYDYASLERRLLGVPVKRRG
jgi:DNA polymerase I-like protein with 3'-5' exonuclease and polymerase domains